jgi:hypothetical protein|tara:strand:+ start:2646 stop:2966 length:321 start_codon:yes stop_codon:yes gene_type:complete
MSNIKINKDIVDFETMSFTDRMNYRAHLAAMMDTIDKINKERGSEMKSPETWCNYSDMPSPKAYDQNVTQSTNNEWVDNEDDDDDYSSSDGEDRRGGVDFDDSNEY